MKELTTSLNNLVLASREAKLSAKDHELLGEDAKRLLIAIKQKEDLEEKVAQLEKDLTELKNKPVTE